MITLFTSLRLNLVKLKKKLLSIAVDENYQRILDVMRQLSKSTTG